MSFLIDQSGKIEQTNKNTVVAIANSIHATIILKAKDKRDLQDIYREAGKPRVFPVQVFSALTYLLIEKAKIVEGKIVEGIVYIDKEYPGHEDLIKSYISQLIIKRGKVRLEPENIRFKLVGKTSNVHSVGYKAFKKGTADFKVTKKDILAMILNYESK